MAFNEDKYKKIFESWYGKGSFDAGLSSARSIGENKARAEYAKQLFNQRKKESENKTYQDALTFWNDPANKSKLKKEGAQKQVDNIRNDPTLQESIKQQGYTVEDYIDAMYNAASDGQFRSEREFNQKTDELVKTTKQEQTARDNDYKQRYGMNYQEKYDFDQKMKAAKKDDKGDISLLKKLGNFFTSKDVDGDRERDGLLGAVDRFVVPISKGATDSIIPGNTERMAQNDPDNPVVKAAQKDRGLETKALNMAGTIGAFAAPYSKAYKAADMAVNKIPSLARIANPYAKSAVTGAVAGGMAEAGISATNELANSEANDMGDYAIRTGLGIAGGAVLDPAILGIANIIKRGRGAGRALQEQSADETLALPEPQQNALSEPARGLPEPQLRLPEPTSPAPSLDRLRNMFRQPNGLSNPIPEMPGIMRLAALRNNMERAGVGFGQNMKNFPKARKDLSPVEAPIDPMNRGQEYWQSRYEDFAKQVNSNYDLNNLTPEALEDLWSSFARYDEPVRLEQAVDLAYPKGFEAPPAPKPEPIPEPEPRTIKDDLREDPRINELVQGLFPPERPISRRATLDEMFEYMRELAPPKKKPSLEPLQFRAKTDMERQIKPGQPSLERLRSLRNPEVAAASESISPAPKSKERYEAISPETEPPLIRVDDPIQDTSFDPKNMKDISGVKAATSDVYRIFRDAFGEDFEKAGKPVLDKLDSAKKNYVDMQEKWAKKLKTEVVDKLGIKKGSKESALVQRYGEKNISLENLKIASPSKWKDIVKADQWFRQAYDEMYATVNQARQTAYPNSPDKQIPKLENYYRHFREMNGLTGLKNIFDSPSQIDPHLAGMSQHTNPSSKWHSFMQKRGMGPYKEDAVGGFLEYIPGASYATNIDPVIPVFKNLRRQLADGTEGSKNINNFIEFLYNYSNDLAGKTNPYFDRNLQQLVGRKTMSLLNWANNRVKKNVILGNIGSTLAQMANIPNGVAFAKQHSVKGAAKTLSSIFDKDAPMHQSPFLKERYLGKMFREFDQRLIEQPEKLAGWMIETSDRIGTSFVWNSVYEKGLKQGVKEPIKYADDITRKLIAGRGVGEVPLLQKAKTTQLVMPFTLEVANLWRVMGDFVKTKDFGAIATLFVGNYLLNKGMEETRGSAVTFDPVDAMLDAFADDELSGTEKSGRLLGEVLTNVPLGQHIAGLYPEDGKVANVKGPTREELFGDRNPQRFGTGLVAANGLSDFAFKFALPFGGNQLKKTLSGIEGLQNEGSYIKDGSIQLPFVGENQKLRYPIDPTPWNSTKAALFGQSATSEAQEYYDNERRPLSENQTTEYDLAKQSGFGKEFYEGLMRQRLSKTTQKKIKEITEDQNLTQEEKQEQILILLEKLNAPK